MSPSAKSCQTTGFVKVPVGGVVGVGVPPPTRARSHCWLVPFQLLYCTTFPPSAVDAPWTSSALPLWRLISATYPSVVSWSRHCWFVPFVSVHCTTGPPSASDRPETSRTLPECWDRIR